MDEINFHTTYASGWRRVSHEKPDKEITCDVPMSTNIYADKLKQPTICDTNAKLFNKTETLNGDILSLENKTCEVIAEAKNLKQTQLDIMNKLNDLQNEMLSLKQLLNTVQENSSNLRQELHQKNQSGKFSKFFK